MRKLQIVIQCCAKLESSVNAALEAHPERISQSITALESEELVLPGAAVQAVRDILASATKAVDVGSVSNATCSTPIRPGLLKAWQLAAHDPDSHVPGWLTEGALAGIVRDIPPAGISPPLDGTVDLEHDSLATPPEFANHVGVEGDPHAEAEVQSYIDKDYLLCASSVHELQHLVGGTPILNKSE